VTKNTNINDKIVFPGDIEGLWSYVYYSFSRKN